MADCVDGIVFLSLRVKRWGKINVLHFLNMKILEPHGTGHDNAHSFMLMTNIFLCLAFEDCK